MNITALDNHIAEVDADAIGETPILPNVGVALGLCPLNLDGAAHSIDDTGKLD